MNSLECLLSLVIGASTLAPPAAPDQTALKKLKAAGIKFQGRDPFDGTGLCGALLPVHFPADVHYVTLPRDVTIEGIHLLKHCPNIRQVRSERALTEAEHGLIRSRVQDGTLFLYRVRTPTGIVIQRAIREDTNGDGVVDENDELDAGSGDVVEGYTIPIVRSSFQD